MITRRGLLAGGATLGGAVTGGCMEGVPDVLGGSGSEQLSFSIKTAPADADEPATRIARTLATNLQAVGVDATVVLKRTDELRRDILQRGAFDVYVDRLPIPPDPDALRSLLHSDAADRVGWHNPFGVADPEVDELLTTQRRTTGSERRDAVGDLLLRIAETQPLVAVARPTVIAAVRTDRFENWPLAPVHSPLRYLGLEHRGRGPAPRLDLAVTDDRITRNLNPLSALYRERGTVTGLLYEPLGRRWHGRVRPWLARDWTWSNGDQSHVEVELRSDLQWHDGEPLEADDVVFTYRFLQDTSLGRADAVVPAPRYYGRASLVEGVEYLGPTTVRLTFGKTPAPVARRAVTAPILPRHIWEPLAVETNPDGVATPRTEAIVWSNPEPVGSGPLTVGSRVVEETLVLERFDEHFLQRSTARDWPRAGLDYRQLHLRVTPAPATAVELAETGTVDGTMVLTDPAVVPRIGRATSLMLTVDQAPSLYHIGCNTNREPFESRAFRRAVARFLPKATIATTVLDDYGVPIATPYASTDWSPPDLAWNGADPEVPFLGTDGELDVDRGREHLRNVGYEVEDGVVVGQ